MFRVCLQILFADVVARLGSTLDVVDAVLAAGEVDSEAAMIVADWLDKAEARIAVVVHRARLPVFLGDTLLLTKSVFANLTLAFSVAITLGTLLQRTVWDGVSLALFGTPVASLLAIPGATVVVVIALLAIGQLGLAHVRLEPARVFAEIRVALRVILALLAVGQATLVKHSEACKLGT